MIDYVFCVAKGILEMPLKQIQDSPGCLLALGILNCVVVIDFNVYAG